ncbi:tail protein [Providencia phage vB_PreS_PR1]|uniref:Tail protein n=1 Tax=Providencia phage vB_PreS_PR1 TaxID=1931407 RepID=A0A1S6KUW3_9CAUD|nr:straight fibre tail protein [Providencia phage vB_PreS_PR1]AQT25204.1 tail protein [Providencia phage vB_PreS_PR1]
MIKNPSPAKMVLSSIAVGYTKALVYHSPFTDPDTIGKTFWITTGNKEVAQTSQDLNTFYMILEKLTPNTKYSVTGAYWDSMVDSELLANKLSILISDSSNITTLLAPRIKSYKAEMEAAVVGVGTSYLIVDFEGAGQIVELQLSKDGKTWETIYSGEIKEGVRLANIPAGTYKARCRGRVALPDGFTTDISDWTQYPADLVVNYAFTPPSKPTNLTFTAARILDGNERYDVQVKWNWSAGSGANIREFVMYYVSKAEFDKTGWAKAARVNTGATQAAIITGFPWEIPTVFKVEAISWGPSDKNTTASDNANFTLNASIPLDSSFTKTTGIEITYSHIKGQKQVNGKWEQTFLLNASDGSFSLGMLNDKGVAPISMDPVTGTVNVDGRIISNEIYAASVVLSNLTGQDNPKIYSTGKTYGGDTSGVWMGMGKDGLARFDVGNKDSFIRFDGEKIWMSAGVTIGTPNGDITIGDGITGIRQVTIYQLNTAAPSIPVSQEYPPPGWSKTPPSIQDPFKQKIYASTGQLDPVTDKLVSGTNYSQPVQWSGTTGSDGKPGSNGSNGLDGKGTVSIYQLGNKGTVPVASTLPDYPPNGWSTTPPAIPNPLTQCVYVSIGQLDPKTNKLVSGTKWATPVQFTGNNGNNGQDGKPGADGKPGSNGTNGLPGKDGFGLTYVYQVSRTQPVIPGGIEYPPTNWSKTPPANYNPTVEAVYASMGTLDPRTNKLVAGTGWSTPIQWSGIPANPVNNNLLTGTTDLVIVDSSNTSVSKSSMLSTEFMPTVESFNLLKGKKVTVSCFIETNGIVEGTAGGRHRIGCEMSITYVDGQTQHIGTWYDRGTATSAVSKATITIQNKEVKSVAAMGVHIQGKTTFGKVSQVKLEEGDVATAWVDAGKNGKPGADGKPGANGTNGTPGANGQRGPGFYRQGRGAAGWSDADATAFFKSTFSSTPVQYDVLTQYHTANPKAGITRQWNGSSWTNPALMVHGDMVLDGTITSKKIVADQAFFAQTGINVIYDRAAALSSNPEGTYKMKIDLQNGSIHIR